MGLGATGVATAGATVAVVDNASIHKEPSTLALLVEVTRGRYAFASAYSNRFKPIERGFANVLCDAKMHEEEALRDPFGVLQRSFVKYSILGPSGPCGPSIRPVSRV